MLQAIRTTPTVPVVRFAMIETAQAPDSLDAILSVEGLDAIYIGPSDLSISLACRPSSTSSRARIARGFHCVTVSSDARLLAAGAHDILQAMRAPS